MYHLNDFRVNDIFRVGSVLWMVRSIDYTNGKILGEQINSNNVHVYHMPSDIDQVWFCDQ